MKHLITFLIVSIILSSSLVWAFSFVQSSENFVINTTSGKVEYRPLNNTWLKFTGFYPTSKQRVDTPLNVSNYNVTSRGFSWCLWANPNGTSDLVQQGMITMYPTTELNPKVTLRWNSNFNRTMVGVVNSAGTQATDIVGATNAVPRGRWTFICLVYNSTESFFGTGRLWVNATASSSRAYSSIVFPQVVANTTISIGCYNSANAQNFGCYNGSIEGVRIYNRSLTSVEMADLYGAGRR